MFDDGIDPAIQPFQASFDRIGDRPYLPAPMLSAASDPSGFSGNAFDPVPGRAATLQLAPWSAHWSDGQLAIPCPMRSLESPASILDRMMLDDAFLPLRWSEDDGALMKLSNVSATEDDIPGATVTGSRYDPYTDGSAGDPGALPPPGPGDSTSIEPGEGTSDGTPGDDLIHPETCSSVAGAADQIRSKILGAATDGSSLTRSASQVEYGTFIVGAGGSFGAANSMIYTDGLESQVNLNDNIPADVSTIYGMIHNHTGFGTAERSLINFYSYPSADDWLTAESLVGRGVPSDQLSIWIIAPDGALREFKYADRAAYQSLTEDQKMKGEGLPSSSTVKGCGGAQ